MKKLSIIQSRVIAIVLALGVIAGVPRLSLAQPAEPTMTAPNSDAKGQPPSNELERVQPAADPNEGGLDVATAVEIQRRFNELRSEILEGREKTVDWWLTATAISLTLLGVVAVLGGYLTFRRFREVETEARENVATSKQHAENARSLVEEIKAKRDEAESLVGMTAETVGEDPDKTRKAAEDVQEDPKASLIDRAIADAVLLQEQEKIDEAIEKWHSIANITEEINKELGSHAWFSVGYLCGERDDYEVVLDSYTKAIRLNPNYVEAYYNRGVAKHNLGQYEAALADYNRALELKPDNAGAYNNRGLAKYNLGQYEAAIADYNRVLELKPDYAKAYNNRGLVNLELHQMDEARQNFEKALALAQTAGDEATATKAKSSLQDLDKPKDS